MPIVTKRVKGAPLTEAEMDDNFDSILAKDNQAPYIPLQNYHPATKKYVDDNATGGSGSNQYEILIGSTFSITAVSSTTSLLDFYNNSTFNNSGYSIDSQGRHYIKGLSGIASTLRPLVVSTIRGVIRGFEFRLNASGNWINVNFVFTLARQLVINRTIYYFYFANTVYGSGGQTSTQEIRFTLNPTVNVLDTNLTSTQLSLLSRDVDTIPTEGSVNLVTSGGVRDAFNYSVFLVNPSVSFTSDTLKSVIRSEVNNNKVGFRTFFIDSEGRYNFTFNPAISLNEGFCIVADFYHGGYLAIEPEYLESGSTDWGSLGAGLGYFTDIILIKTLFHLYSINNLSPPANSVTQIRFTLHPDMNLTPAQSANLNRINYYDFLIGFNASGLPPNSNFEAALPIINNLQADIEYERDTNTDKHIITIDHQAAHNHHLYVLTRTNGDIRDVQLFNFSGAGNWLNEPLWMFLLIGQYELNNKAYYLWRASNNIGHNGGQFKIRFNAGEKVDSRDIKSIATTATAGNNNPISSSAVAAAIADTNQRIIRAEVSFFRVPPYTATILTTPSPMPLDPNTNQNVGFYPRNANNTELTLSSRYMYIFIYIGRRSVIDGLVIETRIKDAGVSLPLHAWTLLSAYYITGDSVALASVDLRDSDTSRTFCITNRANLGSTITDDIPTSSLVIMRFG